MSLEELLRLVQIDNISANVLAIGILLASIIQISPIKINPWDGILKWIGDKLNSGIRLQLAELRRDLDDHIIAELRGDILNFARRCRRGVEHSEEQWHHVLTQARRYETYIESHDIENGAIEEETKYIRRLHQELCRDGRI